MQEEISQQQVGVGPHPRPWPTGEQYDPELLLHGDIRNVEDKYRYLTVAAIKKDLERSSHLLHVAIENWQHDSNIGTIVRTANAFNVGAVHIIGKRHWNRRGAMVTDRYMNIFHHPDVSSFLEAMKDYHIIAVDNTPGSEPLHTVSLPERTVLVYGGEGPGISQELQEASEHTIAIEQWGSTRSLNVGVAAGITMYAWTKEHLL